MTLNFNSKKNDSDLDFEPVEEYWVVAFFKSFSRKKLYRQFSAAGYYEAFDIVMTFSEKTSYKIIWFKEKRKCDLHFKEIGIPWLECICTFCNNEFNNIEPIKCDYERDNSTCKSEFCSLKCRQDHIYFKHIQKRSKF